MKRVSPPLLNPNSRARYAMELPRGPQFFPLLPETLPESDPRFGPMGPIQLQGEPVYPFPEEPERLQVETQIPSRFPAWVSAHEYYAYTFGWQRDRHAYTTSNMHRRGVPADWTLQDRIRAYLLLRIYHRRGMTNLVATPEF